MTIKTFRAAVLATAILGFPLTVIADEGGAMVKGEVTKVDESAGKVTIKHEAIPNLDMDPMTMVFKAGDGIPVKDIKAGDKIEFHAEKINGQLTVTHLEKAK